MEAPKRPTITDIALLTGISRSTVSRVISGRGYVSEEKREIINEALIKLNYQPQKKHKTKSLGDMVLVVSGLLTSPVQVILIQNIVSALETSGMKGLISYNEFNPYRLEEYLAYAAERNFAGIILLGIIETPGVIRQLKRMNCPIVLLNQKISGLEADYIMLDDYQGGYIAAQKLIQLGHRRIGLLMGYAKAKAAIKRETGFRDAYKHAGLPVRESDIYYGDFTEESGMEFAERIIKRQSGITGIISCNDLMSAGLIFKLTQASYRIPEDYSIIGFANNFVTSVTGVNLTSVYYDFEAIALTAAEMIIDRHKNPYSEFRDVLFSPELKQGDSVSFPRDQTS